MQHRSTEDESLDEFVTRARTQTQMCEFSDAEMEDRIIELVTTGSRMEVFRRELLGQDKDLTLRDVLKESRKHETVALGTQQLLNELKIDQITTKKHCGNCGLHHKYQQCPACKNTCEARGNKGHWQKMCRLSRKFYKRTKKDDDTKK